MRLHEESLIHVCLTGLKLVRRTRHKEPPGAICCFVREPSFFFVARFQASGPVAKCEGIMLSQALEIPDREVARMKISKDLSPERER